MHNDPAVNQGHCAGFVIGTAVSEVWGATNEPLYLLYHIFEWASSYSNEPPHLRWANTYWNEPPHLRMSHHIFEWAPLLRMSHHIFEWATTSSNEPPHLRMSHHLFEWAASISSNEPPHLPQHFSLIIPVDPCGGSGSQFFLPLNVTCLFFIVKTFIIYLIQVSNYV